MTAKVDPRTVRVNPFPANHDYSQSILLSDLTVIGNEMRVWTSIFELFCVKFNKYE